MSKLLVLVFTGLFLSSCSHMTSGFRSPSNIDNIDAKVRAFNPDTLESMPWGDKRPQSAREISRNLLNCLSTVEFTYRRAPYTEIYARGRITVNNDLVEDLKGVLQDLLDEPAFSMSLVETIDEFAWDDERSMRSNNTSGFNYRYIGKTKELSNHSKGRAIDINPRVNPWVSKRGSMQPANASVNTLEPGSFLPGSVSHHLVRAFKKRGWTWGGDWTNSKDYQHFEKVITYPGSKYCENPNR